MFTRVPIPQQEEAAGLDTWTQAALADLRAAAQHGQGISIPFDRARPYPPLYHQLYQAFNASKYPVLYRLKTRIQKPADVGGPADTRGYALIAWFVSKEGGHAG